MNAAKAGLWTAAVVAVGVMAACGGGSTAATAAGEPSAAPAPAALSARQEAQQVFSTRCAACHGPSGHGDGPGASGLNPKPRNYHDRAWQAQVKDDEIEKAIVYGGAAVGRSPGMVGNPDLAGKPEVVAALRSIVREFGKEQ
jgi:mono/diheme cytochrome c family protein